MGKSRKGKKAWRSNISTQDIEDFYDKSTKDALSGGSLTQLPSDSLFFLDKSRDLSVKRKIDKSRDKILRVDSILQKNSFVKPVPSSNTKKCRNYKEKDLKTTEATSFKKKDASTMLLDIWNDQGDHAVKKRKVSNKAIVIPAVEVEPPGCSYNPTSESHQDSLAQAVADEMQKVYTKELRPAPVPLTVEGGVIDEEDMYFLDADNESDDDVEGKDADENDDADLEKRGLEKLKMEAEAKKIKDFSKDLDSLPDIIGEIAREDEEKKKRHLRCVTAKQERLKSCLFKFEPAPVQVLLSEEITGSLRKLKACCTLARDRYKSFEKRGIIVPTAKSGRK
ncbi:putative ribosome biogenesis protein Nop53/GLTSCR2 [Helianthus annuus]|nr:putative ribosome biogenesis protein Nop53/GLTSCR2 [Helianthus annuus]